MTDQNKSLIRHLLTALGFLLATLGVADAAEVVDFLLVELNNIWDAVLVLVGVVTSVVGFFQNKERWGKETAK
jgi:hypothetical protein